MLPVDPIGEKDLQLSVDPAPVLTPSRPFFRDIDHCEIKHFQQTVVGRKYRLRFRHFPQLAVESLNRVGGVDEFPKLLRELEVCTEISPVFTP